MKKVLIFLYLCVCAFLIGATIADGQTVSGNVVYWYDADTVQFRANGGKHYRVRFSGIDAPELRQTAGKECRTNLINATKSKPATLVVLGTDRYFRVIGRISTTEIDDLSLWTIQSGCAWEYSAPLDRKTTYQNAEQTARSAQLVLWSDTSPVEPWAFRAGQIRN